MADIAFIGVGNMGGPMALNLLKDGHRVRAFDLDSQALKPLAAEGAEIAPSAYEAAGAAEAVITMLPAGRHVRGVYMDDAGVIAAAAEAAVGEGTLLIDCSTIDVESARTVAEAAAAAGLDMVDAPVSGGVAGAGAGALTFMVGGTDRAFARAKPLLDVMGKAVVHAGPSGNGQVAKICNNMILGVSMIVVSEAFTLGRKLGLAPEKLFEISSQASGQCWSMTSYCPVPGPVPASPANRDYQAGFTAAMMLKDLKLAQAAAHSARAATPLGAKAQELYDRFCEGERGSLDFSGIIKLIEEGA